MTYECFASCAFGIEGLVGYELQQLGMEDVRNDVGRVFFKTDEMGIALANLWLRTADRVYIVLGMFEAHTFDELFNEVVKLPFSDLIPPDGAVPVSGNAVQSDLMSVSDIQSITKKAIVTAMQGGDKNKVLPESGPRFHVYANNLKDVFTICVNTSGAGLNRRGYRIREGEAPLRETLAAALIAIARWRHRDFYDPMCGSGTIAIEAAMIAANMAPGANRRFDAQTFSPTFAAAFADARRQAEDGIRKPEMHIYAFDRDERAISAARENAERAGVLNCIHFRRANVLHFKQPPEPSIIVTNPPYGVRMGEKENVETLYRSLGETLSHLQNTPCFFLSQAANFQRLYGRRADKRRKLYNGNMICYYYQYFRRRR